MIVLAREDEYTDSKQQAACYPKGLASRRWSRGKNSSSGTGGRIMFNDQKPQKDIAERNTEIDISRKHRLLKKEKKKEKRRMEMEQNDAKRRMIQNAVGHKKS